MQDTLTRREEDLDLVIIRDQRASHAVGNTVTNEGVMAQENTFWFARCPRGEAHCCCYSSIVTSGDIEWECASRGEVYDVARKLVNCISIVGSSEMNKNVPHALSDLKSGYHHQ